MYASVRVFRVEVEEFKLEMTRIDHLSSINTVSETKEVQYDVSSSMGSLNAKIDYNEEK